MSPSRIKALLKEFPFLTSGDPPLVDEDRVEEIYVSRIGPELLVTAAYREEIKMARADVEHSLAIFILDRKGRLLTEVQQGSYFKSTIGCRTEKSSRGEQVIIALSRVSLEEVGFIVVRETGHQIEHNRSQGGYTITLYKRPQSRKFGLERLVDVRRVIDGLKSREE